MSGQAESPMPGAGWEAHWTFRLYVAGQRPRSLAALANLKRLCERHLPGHHRIEVIDLLLDPARAEQDQIIAIPTLLRLTPRPAKKVFGDLSDESRAVAELELVSPDVTGSATAARRLHHG